MKVVLFAGGQGIRLREHSERIPKPMVPIGYRPVLWHLMKYYAHFNHRDFVLCLGYRADVIKEYFLNYNEAMSNDFTLSNGGRGIDLLSSDIHDWRITFADTGLHANIGQRLRAVRKYVQGEEYFLANYGDVLTNAPMNELIDEFKRQHKIAAFIAVRPSYSFHVVQVRDDNVVSGIEPVAASDIWLNAGFFIFRQEIFDYLHEGEELVEEPFNRLVKEEQLMAFKYSGFWAPMDTLKDHQSLEETYTTGRAPWALWNDMSRD
jgi:glucose-1-phosphate cytidylyltransferase